MAWARLALSQWRSLAWIISARRILSAIFAVTDGDGRISSVLSRTAAMSEAAMSIAAFDLFSSRLLFVVPSLRCAEHVLLGDGRPLNTSAGL